MTALFGSAVARRDDVQPEGDVLGGFQRLDSNVYDFTVEMAYALQSESGSKGIHLTLVDTQAQQYRENLYVTSGTEKGGTNYFTNRDGKKQYLPSFVIANDLCIAITGKELAEMQGTEKDVKVTVWEDDKPVERLEKKQVLMDLVGGRVSLGILKQLEDGYPDATQERERNTIDKVFEYGTRLTIVEKEAGLESGDFVGKWLERNKDSVRDRRKESKNSGGASNAKAGAPVSKAPSLFG